MKMTIGPKEIQELRAEIDFSKAKPLGWQNIPSAPSFEDKITIRKCGQHGYSLFIKNSETKVFRNKEDLVAYCHNVLGVIVE